MNLINFRDYNNTQVINNFLRDYDLIHSHDYTYDLYYFLLNGKFFDWNMQFDYNEQLKNGLKKDINDDFYKGFNG